MISQMLAYAFALCLWCASAQTASSKPAIVSPDRPTDSRGETVYEAQGDTQKDIPAVPGVLVPSRQIKLVQVKYSKALKKEKFAGDIVLYGVIAANGDVIDLRPAPGQDAEAVACAKTALEQSRFAAATLDGKPVAVLMKTQVTFVIR